MGKEEHLCIMIWDLLYPCPRSCQSPACLRLALQMQAHTKLTKRFGSFSQPQTLICMHMPRREGWKTESKSKGRTWNSAFLTSPLVLQKILAHYLHREQQRLQGRCSPGFALIRGKWTQILGFGLLPGYAGGHFSVSFSTFNFPSFPPDSYRRPSYEKWRN